MAKEQLEKVLYFKRDGNLSVLELYKDGTARFVEVKDGKSLATKNE